MRAFRDLEEIAGEGRRKSLKANPGFIDVGKHVTGRN